MNMLRTEVRFCTECKKRYVWKKGGIVVNHRDIDLGLCPLCQCEKGMDMLKNIFDKKN